ncbi:aminodeoxychorismate/anthranilate synthase component II [Candidatus Atribacteria bacterium MT.SAG.1]|nr:aminodeoxychorismate/anthranilate synthase component II [Candidatus Atribacteria bacterium MT.SAG.1]
MILVIDNYDSFTYNLVQYLGELGIKIQVYRNDKISIREITKKDLTGIVISPGPCTPKEAGISVEVVQKLGAKIPILGVCLGHQSIGVAYGGRVVPAKKLMHGKTSPIYHNQKGLYLGIDNPFIAGRYHSLVLDPLSLPLCLKITAHTEDGTIMGIRHKEYPVEGVQFHPESILTSVGRDILKNFITMAEEFKR